MLYQIIELLTGRHPHNLPKINDAPFWLFFVGLAVFVLAAGLMIRFVVFRESMPAGRDEGGGDD